MTKANWKRQQQRAKQEQARQANQAARESGQALPRPPVVKRESKAQQRARESREARTLTGRFKRNPWSIIGPVALIVVVVAGIVAAIIALGNHANKNTAATTTGTPTAVITGTVTATSEVTLTPAAPTATTVAENCTAPSTVPTIAGAPAITGHVGPFNKPQFATAPPMLIDPTHHFTATIVTNKGAIVIALDPKSTPKTVNNFVFLARENYYDCLTFHRYAPGFVIQGGDPLGTGSGGPGYQFADELPPNSNGYTVGAVAMANAGPNTNGSQFFIDIADDTKQLGALYSLFGRVVSGQDVANSLRMGDYMKTVTIAESK